MKFAVLLLPKALEDIDRVLELPSQHTTSGKLAWLEALDAATTLLETYPARFALAPEAIEVAFVLRNISFRTRRGKRHRVLFTIVGPQVRVLRVLGPNHPLLTADDL